MSSGVGVGVGRRREPAGRARLTRVPAAALLAAAVVSTGLLTLVGAGPAVAADAASIPSYDVAMRVGPDGRLHVTETIRYDFGSSPRHGITRDIPTRVPYDKRRDRLYRLHDVTVSSPQASTPTDLAVSDSNGVTSLRIGDPERTVTGRHSYTVRYTIDGALNRFPDHVELFWNAVGADWDVPVGAATAEVTAPTAIRQVACFAGPRGSTTSCGLARADGARAAFAAPRGLPPRNALTVVVGLPVDAVTSAGPILRAKVVPPAQPSARDLLPSAWTGTLGIGIVAIGGVAVLWLVGATGRDRRWAGLTPGVLPAGGVVVAEERVPMRREPVAVAFTPPLGLRPGQIGTLLDEQANVIDVTATIIDLAVRGHLRIEELIRPHWFSPRDWRLLRLDAPSTDELLPYEQELLSGLFESGDDVRLSSLKQKFAARLAAVQTKLYEDVTAAGWFRGRPDRVRGRWSAAGFALAAVGVVLAYLLGKQVSAHWAVVGVAVAVVGLLLSQLGRRMPARTPAGSAVLAQAQGFREYIRTAEAEQLRFEERGDVFSRYLPYAIVFGEAERWVRVFGALAAASPAAATTGPAWYVGPAGWDLGHFSESLTGFTTSASSTFATATPSSSGSSGFGGGGSSGGGGGGGGGGSW